MRIFIYPRYHKSGINEDFKVFSFSFNFFFAFLPSIPPFLSFPPPPPLMSCRLKSGRWPQVSEWCQQSVRLCVCTHEYTLYVCVHVSSKPCQQRAALPTIPWDLWRYPESICAPCDRSCSPTNRLLPIFKTWKAPLIVHFQSSGADSAADTQNSELLISTQTQRCCSGLQMFSVWRLKPNKKAA